MARFPAPNLPVAYTDQTATSSFVGCHNPDGSLNVSFVDEEDNVGAYALNGSLNVSTDDGLSIRTEGGALRVYEDSGFLTLNQGTGGGVPLGAIRLAMKLIRLDGKIIRMGV